MYKFHSLFVYLLQAYVLILMLSTIYINSWLLNKSLKQGYPQSPIHDLFGTVCLECTAGLVCSCISANVTELNCTLEIQGVD